MGAVSGAIGLERARLQPRRQEPHELRATFSRPREYRFAAVCNFTAAPSSPWHNDFLRRCVMPAMVRPPAVAGRFYPGDPATLLDDVRKFTSAGDHKLQARGCVVPHAGYMYSGHVAGAVFAALQLPRRFLILCPNHTGAGEPLAMYRQGRWRTPLGEVAVDEELAAELQRHCDWLSDDPEAHRSEHALEVQLPFLQAMVGDFTFVPIAVGVGQYEPLAALGEAMARALAGREREVLIVASSDMNHYESDAI